MLYSNANPTAETNARHLFTTVIRASVTTARPLEREVFWDRKRTRVKRSQCFYYFLQKQMGKTFFFPGVTSPFNTFNGKRKSTALNTYLIILPTELRVNHSSTLSFKQISTISSKVPSHCEPSERQLSGKNYVRGLFMRRNWTLPGKKIKFHFNTCAAVWLNVRCGVTQASFFLSLVEQMPLHQDMSYF
ncbi:hypothetical protein CEXT_530991 [Caerostris extrusa]|uniref:Uncharacterized protein n=1 Tax=Caerostris extrusa TaxID=172846 RepID=A0AAV4RQ97_CAEEX|nr:hypothetical protein CEXT_530991 [Caerostris extrusa]